MFFLCLTLTMYFTQAGAEKTKKVKLENLGVTQFRLWNNSPKHGVISISAHAHILKEDEYLDKSIASLEGYGVTHEAAVDTGARSYDPFQVQLDDIEDKYADYLVYDVRLDIGTGETIEAGSKIPPGEYTLCPDPDNEFSGATALLNKDDKAYSDYCGSQNAKKKRR